METRGQNKGRFGGSKWIWDGSIVIRQQKMECYFVLDYRYISSEVCNEAAKDFANDLLIIPRSRLERLTSSLLVKRSTTELAGIDIGLQTGVFRRAT